MNMGKNRNSDNEFWPEFERLGKNFVGTPEELDDLIDEVPHRPQRKAKQSKKLRYTDDGGDEQ